MDIANKVREANKIIYNRLADNYEVIDGRRSYDLHIWVRKRLIEISQIIGRGESLLDIGCGTGFVVRAAKGIFTKLYGMDISENILKAISSYGIYPVCADAKEVPFRNESVDVVVLFSVIHHFYDYRPILKETYRVIKPGGVLYIDHDMNKYFFNNFNFFINIYRKLSRKVKIIENNNLKELYELSEFHSKGIDSEEVKDCLISLGFKVVNSYYHWYGLSKLTNFVLGERKFFKKEFAPLMRFVAQK
jgi:ubiquinone/menaquinone biosynthesis C-methylase UbiE